MSASAAVSNAPITPAAAGRHRPAVARAQPRTGTPGSRPAPPRAERGSSAHGRRRAGTGSGGPRLRSRRPRPGARRPEAKRIAGHDQGGRHAHGRRPRGSTGRRSPRPADRRGRPPRWPFRSGRRRVRSLAGRDRSRERNRRPAAAAATAAAAAGQRRQREAWTGHAPFSDGAPADVSRHHGEKRVEAPSCPPSDPFDLILASASPRRRELSQRVGLILRWRPGRSRRDAAARGEAGDYVRRVASAKCDAAVAAEPVTVLRALPVTVLGADTIVNVDGEILGKPRDATDARRDAVAGWRAAATKSPPPIVSGAARLGGGRAARRSIAPSPPRSRSACSSRPSSTPTSPAASGRERPAATRCRGSRRSFAIELRGSHTNVIGLPLAEVVADLRAAGGLAGFPPAAFGVAPSRSDVNARRGDRGPSRPTCARAIAAAAAAAARAAGDGHADRRQQEDAARRRGARRSRPASSTSARTTRRSCATSARRALARRRRGARWHFIGPLQRNKVKYVAGNVGADPRHRLDRAARRGRARARRRARPSSAWCRSTSPARRSKRGVAPGELPALLDVRCAWRKCAARD